MTRAFGSATRRSFLKYAGGAMAAGIVSGIGKASAETLETELVVNDSGGTTSAAHKELFYDPFAKEFGITVRVVSTSSSPEGFAKLRAASQAGHIEWDIISASRESMITQRDLIATLDCQALPNWVAEGTKGSCLDTGLLRFGYGEAIAYNTKSFPAGAEPQSWADFWDTKKFPGPRGFANVGNPWVTLAFALMADGVPPVTSQLFPLDMDRAFRKLDEIKPHVAVWYKTGSQLQQILRDEEVVMSHCWSGRVLALKSTGVPVDVQWNQAILASDFWSLVKGAPHPKAALAFLNYMAGHPKAHAEFARRTSYYGPNAKMNDFLGPDERVVAPESAKTCQVDYEWVSKNRDALIERFNTWLAT